MLDSGSKEYLENLEIRLGEVEIMAIRPASFVKEHIKAEACQTLREAQHLIQTLLNAYKNMEKADAIVSTKVS